MVLRSNKAACLVIGLVLTAFFVSAQEEGRPNERDYKDKKQFERFNKRRAAIGAWQINQLKEGALVVRLRTNNLLINQLLKEGDTILAREKQIETAGINLNTIKAYTYNYNFSKVYFIYSGSSDSLMNGVRKNIFLDTNLQVDPAIVMNESFYLLAERDQAYNSTIGFVKEDSARLVKEEGYGVKEMAVVVKNKYGHQLKRPFPYVAADRPDFKGGTVYVSLIKINGLVIPFNVGGIGKLKAASNSPADKDDKRTASFNYEGKRLSVHIPRYLTYERMSVSISNFNEELRIFYRKNVRIGDEKPNAELLPFLY
ncbi:MAG: hypothetical protein V4635_05870 [Bacteroidota bacterium]